ncbi:MAG: hypothetical protein QM635_07955 [Microbacteriaceae bacterium]
MDGIDDTELRGGATSPAELPFEGTIIRAGPPAVEDGPDSAPPFQLFGFRLSGAPAVIVLDRPAIVGRRPSGAGRQPDIPARLVRVSSPRRLVSAAHLELHQLVAAVRVTDLHSTNGSVLVLPGEPARPLTPGEPVDVGAGALVDIGDGNVVEILSLDEVGR